jgi:hypothetical protein
MTGRRGARVCVRSAIGATAAHALLACTPVVMHGPAVDRGFQVGATLIASKGRDYPRIIPPFVPPGGTLYLAYGWAGKPDRVAMRFAAQLTPLPPKVDSDVYLKLPRRALLGLDGGVGYLAGVFWQPSHQVYAQLGKIGNDGTGFYTTQGFLKQWRGTSSIFNPEAVEATGWVSTVAFQRAETEFSWHVFATGIFGRRLESPCARDGRSCAGLRRPRQAMIGVTLEIDALRHLSP